MCAQPGCDSSYHSGSLFMVVDRAYLRYMAHVNTCPPVAWGAPCACGEFSARATFVHVLLVPARVDKPGLINPYQAFACDLASWTGACWGWLPATGTERNSFQLTPVLVDLLLLGAVLAS